MVLAVVVVLAAVVLAVLAVLAAVVSVVVNTLLCLHQFAVSEL